MDITFDQKTSRHSTGSVRMIQAVWSTIRRLSRPRVKRSTGMEHEVLASMSHYHLRDIGLSRGDVTFGIVCEKGVFNDADD